MVLCKEFQRLLRVVKLDPIPVFRRRNLLDEMQRLLRAKINRETTMLTEYQEVTNVPARLLAQSYQHLIGRHSMLSHAELNGGLNANICQQTWSNHIRFAFIACPARRL